MLRPQTVQPSLESLIQAFFQASEGDWRSQRRYYTPKSGEAQEVMSLLTVRFLAQESNDLRQLAQLHQLADM